LFGKTPFKTQNDYVFQTFWGAMALLAPLATPMLGLVSHCFWEGDSSEEISTRWHCLEKLNHSRDSWLVL